MTDAAVAISVVIPTYRRCALVRQALEALSRQDLPGDRYEVIVSIDGSEDGTRELVERFQAPYRLTCLWHPNRGRAAACNAGVHAAGGDLIALLDDDMEAAPGLLGAHLRAQAAAGFKLAAMGAAPITPVAGASPTAAYIAAKFNDHLAALARPGRRFGPRDIYTGNFSVSRRAFLMAGGFDEAFGLYGNEDVELSIRLRRAGLEVTFLPDAVARQHYTKGFAELARDSVAKGRTSVLLAGLHPDMLPELKLGAYRAASPKRRLLRSGLLGLGAAWNPTPDLVVRLAEQVERRSPDRFGAVSGFVLDYLYWHGVRAALRENRRAGRGMTRLG